SEKRLGRNAPIAVEFPSHLHRQPALARQNVRGTLARTDQAPKVGLRVAAKFHAIADCVDRIRRFDRPFLALVVLKNKRQQIETVRLRRSRLRLVFKIAFNLRERRPVVGLRADWADWLLRHVTVSGSMRSYSACVPMNFTSTWPNT